MTSIPPSSGSRAPSTGQRQGELNDMGKWVIASPAAGTFLIAVVLVFVPSHQAESLPQQLGPTTAQAQNGNEIVLPDDRLIVGMVEDVKDNEVKVNTGELMPRFLPLKENRQNQRRSLIKGDLLEIWVNNQDLVVDYHPLDTLGWHRIISGSLVQPLAVDQEWAVIKPAKGKEEAFAIRPLAKSKVAALPVGAPALFLIDKAKKIVDVTFGNEQALQQAIQGWRGSPPMGVDREIRGTFVKSGPSNQVTILTSEGAQQTFEARPFLQKKLNDLARGTRVILLIDGENKVTDIAIPPGCRGMYR